MKKVNVRVALSFLMAGLFLLFSACAGDLQKSEVSSEKKKTEASVVSNVSDSRSEVSETTDISFEQTSQEMQAASSEPSLAENSSQTTTSGEADYEYLNSEPWTRPGKRINISERPKKGVKATDVIFTVEYIGANAFYNSNGEMLLGFDYYDAGVFSEGLATVKKRTDDIDNWGKFGGNSKSGYINTKGEVVIDFKHTYTADFSEGYALVGENGEVLGRVLYSFINKKGGAIIVPANITEVKSFSGGKSRARKNGQYGYITKDFEFIPNAEEKDENFVVKKDKLTGKYGYWNAKSETWSIEPKFLYARDFEGDIAIVEDSPVVSTDENEAYAVINKKGEYVVEPRIYTYPDFKEGMACVYFETGEQDKIGRYIRKYGYINAKGKIIADAIYDRAGDFSDGLAAVRVGEKWGYINKKGKMVIKPKFDKAEAFVDGMAVVGIDTGTADKYNEAIEYKCGMIDKKGKYVIKPKYDYLEPFKKGFAKYGIDTGEDSVSFYDAWDSNGNPLGGAEYKNKYYYGIIDKKENVIIEAKFDDVRYIPNEEQYW